MCPRFWMRTGSQIEPPKLASTAGRGRNKAGMCHKINRMAASPLHQGFGSHGNPNPTPETGDSGLWNSRFQESQTDCGPGFNFQPEGRPVGQAEAEQRKTNPIDSTCLLSIAYSIDTRNKPKHAIFHNSYNLEGKCTSFSRNLNAWPLRSIKDLKQVIYLQQLIKDKPASVSSALLLEATEVDAPTLAPT